MILVPFMPCVLLVASDPRADAAGLLDELRAATAAPTVVRGRLLTRILSMQELDAVRRERLLTFLAGHRDCRKDDPETGESTDALRRCTIARDGHGSSRIDWTYEHVYVNSGDPRVESVVWTPAERIHRIAQSSAESEVSLIEPCDASCYRDQIARGILPWDISRTRDGGYFGCVEVATRLLSEAGDTTIEVSDGFRVIRSSDLGIRLEYDADEQIVTSIRFRQPGSLGTLAHRFGGRVADPRGLAHPEWWIVTLEDTERPTKPWTVVFESVVGTGFESVSDRFGRSSMGSLFVDASSGVVTGADGSVDDSATRDEREHRTARPVVYFDETSEGGVPRTRVHRKGERISPSAAVVLLGFSTIVVGGLMWYRSGSAR